MAELVRANAGIAPGCLIVNGTGPPMRPSAELRVRLQAPGFDGEVHLKDLDGRGQIQDITTANLGAAPRYKAGTTIGMGRNGDDLVGHTTESSATEMMVAIMTCLALFPQARPITEAGAAYLDALEQALTELRRQGGAVSMDAVVLTTARPGG